MNLLLVSFGKVARVMVRDYVVTRDSHRVLGLGNEGGKSGEYWTSQHEVVRTCEMLIQLERVLRRSI